MSEFKIPEELINNTHAMRRYEVRLATSIGYLVITFNRLEHDLGVYLAAFMKNSSNSEHIDNIKIMTAALSFGQKLDLLSALYLKRYEGLPAQCEIFKLIINKLSKFEEYRNTQVHSRWGMQKIEDSELTRSKPNVKGRKGLRQVTEQADWRQIRDMSKKMTDFSHFEMTRILRGCTRYEEMSDETINILKQRLTLINRTENTSVQF